MEYIIEVQTDDKEVETFLAIVRRDANSILHFGKYKTFYEAFCILEKAKDFKNFVTLKDISRLIYGVQNDRIS